MSLKIVFNCDSLGCARSHTYTLGDYGVINLGVFRPDGWTSNKESYYCPTCSKKAARHRKGQITNSHIT